MNDRKREILIVMQRALLGEVSPNLRAVTVSYDNNRIHFEAFYDGLISDEDKESMSCVETELLAAFSETDKITYEVKRADYPNPIPQDRIWVYSRREPD